MKSPEEVEKLAQKAYDLGFEYEVEYRGCGQCALGALQDALGVKNDAVFKAATGFGGGIGLAGDSACGAYVAGVMFLSSLKGREKDNFADPERVRFQAFANAKKLHDKFIEEYGSVNCQGIQNKIFGRPFFLWDEDQMKKFDDAGGHADKCPHVVGLAAKCTVELAAELDLL